MAVAYTLFREVLEFLASTPMPEMIVAFQPSDELVQRSRYLLERNCEGMLTREEHEELDEFSRMNHFMSMLKITARKKL